VKIDKEEYEAWREHPVTAAVFAELRELAESRKQMWISISWGSGDPDREKLAMLRGQAEGFAFLPNADHAKLFGDEE